jgi:hypothetical protein
VNKQQTTEFAKLLGLKKIDTSSRSGWLVCRCPFAHWKHDRGDATTAVTFGIRFGKDFAHCFSCQWSGSLSDMLYHLAVLAKGNKVAGDRIKAADHYLDTEGKTVLTIGKEVDEDEDLDTITEWPEWQISSFIPAPTHPYLVKRGVPEAVAKIMDFRYDMSKQRLGVPVRDWDGRLMGFHGRDTTGVSAIPYLAYTKPKYNRPVWLGEHWLDVTKPVLVVESVFDLARALQVYRNSCCPLMASINKAKATRLSEALQIAEMLDPDQAGRAGAKKLKMHLPDTQFISPGLPAGYKDVGEMEPLVLAARLQPYLDLDQLLT